MQNLESIYLPEVDTQRPLVIAGPCSAETQKQVLETAHQLAEMGIKIFRAGVWKPRTKPGGFEGVGTKALPWLQQVKRETGMYISTEVATAKHVEQALRHNVDILWVGARTTTNPFAMQEIADSLQGVDIPVLVKNPVSPDVELWIGGLERLYNAGVRRLGAIHRGFSYADKSVYRNMPHWHIPIEVKRRFPHLPLICDPSHISGQRSMILKLSQQAMDLNFDGIIVETHSHPDDAWSDSMQQITPSQLQRVLQQLIIRNVPATTEDLSELRRQIDEMDNTLLELLAKRMRISREIGRYKLENEMPILQTTRYDEILSDRALQGEKMQLSGDFVRKILENIHEESIRQQFSVMEKGEEEKE